jgi:hypothetical protein
MPRKKKTQDDPSKAIVVPVPDDIYKRIFDYKMDWQTNVVAHRFHNHLIVKSYSRKGGWYFYVEGPEGKPELNNIETLLNLFLPMENPPRMGILFPLNKTRGVELWEMGRPPETQRIHTDPTGRILGKEVLPPS